MPWARRLCSTNTNISRCVYSQKYWAQADLLLSGRRDGVSGADQASLVSSSSLSLSGRTAERKSTLSGNWWPASGLNSLLCGREFTGPHDKHNYDHAWCVHVKLTLFLFILNFLFISYFELEWSLMTFNRRLNCLWRFISASYNLRGSL